MSQGHGRIDRNADPGGSRLPTTGESSSRAGMPKPVLRTAASHHDMTAASPRRSGGRIGPTVSFRQSGASPRLLGSPEYSVPGRTAPSPHQSHGHVMVSPSGSGFASPQSSGSPAGTRSGAVRRSGGGLTASVSGRSRGGRSYASSRAKEVVIYGDESLEDTTEGGSGDGSGVHGGADSAAGVPNYPKSDDERTALTSALTKHFFFKSLRPAELSDVVAALEPTEFEPGDLLADCGIDAATAAGGGSVLGSIAMGTEAPSFLKSPGASIRGLATTPNPGARSSRDGEGGASSPIPPHGGGGGSRDSSPVATGDAQQKGGSKGSSTAGSVQAASPAQLHRSSTGGAGHGGAGHGGVEASGPLAGRFIVVGEGSLDVRKILGMRPAPSTSAGAVGVTSVTPGGSHHGSSSGGADVGGDADAPDLTDPAGGSLGSESQESGGGDSTHTPVAAVAGDAAGSTVMMESVEGEVSRKLGPGDSFGESALVYDRPRGETVRAGPSGVKVYSMDAATLRRVLARHSARSLGETREALKQVSILQKLTPEQLGRVALSVTEHTFRAGDRVIKKGDHGDSMYFIKQGSVRCTNIGSGARKIADVVLQAGSCVGERALMLDDKRAADVVVEPSGGKQAARAAAGGAGSTGEPDAVLLRLSREDVDKMLGPLADVMDRNMTVNVLRSVPLFSALTKKEREAVAAKVETRSFTKGDVLCRKGEIECPFCIVRDGAMEMHGTAVLSSIGLSPVDEASATDADPGSAGSKPAGQLSSSDYFGDKQLLAARAPCEHTIQVASDTATVLALERSQFMEVVGSVSAYLRRMDAADVAAMGLPRSLRPADSFRVSSGSGGSLKGGKRGRLAAALAAAASDKPGDGSGDGRIEVSGDMEDNDGSVVSGDVSGSGPYERTKVVSQGSIQDRHGVARTEIAAGSSRVSSGSRSDDLHEAATAISGTSLGLGTIAVHSTAAVRGNSPAHADLVGPSWGGTGLDEDLHADAHGDDGGDDGGAHGSGAAGAGSGSGAAAVGSGSRRPGGMPKLDLKRASADSAGPDSGRHKSGMTSARRRGMRAAEIGVKGSGRRGDFDMAMGGAGAGAGSSKSKPADDSILIDAGSSLPALKSIARRLDTDMKRSDLEPVRTIGVGTFGRVRMVRDRRTGRLYALKTLRKATVVRLRQQRNVCYEKAVLAAIRHPFLIQLQAAFQDEECLYLVLELVLGGELFGLLETEEILPEASARFYSACVLSGLAHLHERRILYRDLKPENLLLDKEGYIRICDFGFSKYVPAGSMTRTLCGTPDFLAPECLLSKGHNEGADYWALGVLIYEMLSGDSPFAVDDGDQVKIFKRILNSDTTLEFPEEVEDESPGAVRLVRGLLQKRLSDRLGCRRAGVSEILEHEWFSAIDFGELLRKEIEAPWVPKLESEDDTQFFDDYSDEEEEEEEEERLQPGTDLEWCKDF